MEVTKSAHKPTQSFIFLTSCWLLIVFSQVAWSLKFNEDEMIILKGSDPALAANEGYLYLSVDSEDHFTTVILDRVGSGKRLKFTDLEQGENHALVKLQAGTYYWISIRGYFLYGLNWFHFDEDDFYFEVKPGVVNYPGTWQSNFNFMSPFQGYLSLKATNKSTIEYPYFKQNYQQLTGDAPFFFSGHTVDRYNQYLESVIAKYDFKTTQKIDYQNIKSNDLPIGFFDIDDGVDQQLEQFPSLADYLKNDDQVSGEINPAGEWVLLSSKQNIYTVIELVNINTLKSYVVFKEILPARTRVRNLQWIDKDSFLYDLDYERYSFSQVLHLDINNKNQITGAQVVELPIGGAVLSPLTNQENLMIFANYALQEVSGKNINGVYLVDTTSSKSMKKSFKKKHLKTKKFEKVIDWITDTSGQVRSAIEVEYDEDEERVLYHHWFLPNKNSDDWVKIKTSVDDDDIPLPVKLSEDESFFYAFSDQFGDKVSVHKYSVTDYAYLEPFFEDEEVDIVSLIQDPTTRNVIGYTYLENGLSKRKFFDEQNDRIKAIRTQNPNMTLYVRQHLEKDDLMMIYGTTQYSKGAWYLYKKADDQIIKLIDESPAYEKLPKGDNFSLKITAKDGVEIEGYLVVPSLRTDDKLPLIVIPHGGPIGVRDTAYNDEIQHFFASKGVATLKVNYRGSGGYGKQFEALGNQQWGEKIEADIHQMVLHAAAQHRLNLKQVCAMGGSYGGYSAVMLTILYPSVYQCAVSLHGVMDLPLLFANDSLLKDDEFYEELAEIVGDPRKDLERLLNKSPFYLVEKINKPIKLFHGVKDERVTLEHSLRMQQMFTILNMDADLTILMNEGHSMKHLNSNIFYVAESFNFIAEQLGIPLPHKSSDNQELKNETSVTDYINGQ